MNRRESLRRWLDQALAAIDAEELVYRQLAGTGGGATVFAIGKAAAAMTRGAARALGDITGICITNTSSPTPAGVEVVIGDHPIPGPASLEAGRRALDLAGRVEGRCIALISGGGSALCEAPLPGIEPGLIVTATRALLESGAPIEDLNLVRSHLSAIKSGGLARAIGGPVETYVLSDVSGHDVGYVASGPTLACPRQPDRAIELMEAHGLSVDAAARASMKAPPPPTSNGPVTVIADGMTAARAVAAAAAAEAVGGKVHSDWLTGPVEMCLASLMATSGPGLTVGAGEPSVRVTGGGAGGRNTHAALLAAMRIAGTDTVFAALATDGVDGSSGAAGAIVDGATVARGRRVEQALAGFDSAGYLAKTGDLVVTGPTGTNVADLWAIWRS